MSTFKEQIYKPAKPAAIASETPALNEMLSTALTGTASLEMMPRSDVLISNAQAMSFIKADRTAGKFPSAYTVGNCHGFPWLFYICPATWGIRVFASDANVSSATDLIASEVWRDDGTIANDARYPKEGETDFLMSHYVLEGIQEFRSSRNIAMQDDHR